MGFDARDLSGLADPWSCYDDLRSAAPVQQIDGGFVGIFDYTSAERALRDPAFTSSPIALAYAASLPPGALHDEMTNRINFLDPPDHPRVRSLVAKAFTPRRVDDVRPWVRATTTAIVDSLEVDHGRIEIMAPFAHQIPSLIISELLGVPVADRDRLTELSDRVTPVFGTSVEPALKAQAIEAAEEMHGYFSLLADQRSAQPCDDLLTALVTVEEDGERLSRAEFVSLVATLYSAGHRTTRDLFGNGLDLALRAGIDVATVDHALLGEELLRLATPTHYVGRVPQQAVELGGVTIEAWQPCLIFLAAANRDPAVYDAPHELRLDRKGPPALSFAFGAHYCLGASLARMELVEMIRALTTRFPRLGAAPEPQPWHQRGPFRGFDSLEILVEPG